MENYYNLNRFTDAQAAAYEIAMSEIKKGRKRSHWMWYIFPQIQGLGFSTTSQFYGIRDIGEAKAFLKHEVLGKRLISICEELIKLEGNSATKIFGSPDDMKLKSCMTLFACLENTNAVFQLVLDKFFNGARDSKTLQIIKNA